MKRFINQQLENWVHSARRKPLLLRGTRQVGKTYPVETLAKETFKTAMLDIGLMHYL